MSDPGAEPSMAVPDREIPAEAAEGGENRHLHRVLTFVDASVAIALTLLVLPLVDLSTGLSEGGSVAHLLGDHLDELGAFVLSFVVIARLWFAQHRVVHDWVRVDAVGHALLMLWTLTIVFLPFPTSLVATSTDQLTTRALYLGTMGVSMIVLAAMSEVARRRHYLPAGVASRVAPSVVNAGLLLIALVLSLTIPNADYFPLLLLAFDTQVESAGRHLLRRGRA